jgi:hypothetical protein
MLLPAPTQGTGSLEVSVTKHASRTFRLAHPRNARDTAKWQAGHSTVTHFKTIGGTTPPSAAAAWRIAARYNNQ